MKKVITYIFLVLIAVACAVDSSKTPYSGDELNKLSVKVNYPAEYAGFNPEGMVVKLENIDNGNKYSAKVDKSGSSTLDLTNGRYIIQFSSRHDKLIFNATSEFLLSDASKEIALDAEASVAGNIIFKEIYCGGCSKKPEDEGEYSVDKYTIIHNNENKVTYLDGLCIAMLAPYNAGANNEWNGEEYDGIVTVADAIWQFGGDGTTFPLQPGEDAVICHNGAIDHSAIYSSSVNLNKSDYFVLYNSLAFPSPTYHPTPGSNIQPERHLDLVQKFGIASAWAISKSSPAVILFTPVGDQTIEQYLAQDGKVNTTQRVAFIPQAWVLDGVEVFNGQSSGNSKRLRTAVDAGFVTQSATNVGKSLHRIVDEELSKEFGFEVLMDSNNSSNDFYERSEASLHE